LLGLAREDVVRVSLVGILAEIARQQGGTVITR